MKESHDKNAFFRRKRVFLTGHNGFIGSWLTQVLVAKGAIIHGYSLPLNPDNMYSHLELQSTVSESLADIMDVDRLNREILAFKPEIIVHLAAQPIVTDSFSDPINTLNTNVIGTANVLETARKCESLRALISFTSDKVYRNDGKGFPFVEADPLGGYDPYSASKSCADIVTTSYRKSFFDTNKIGISSIRAGNVVGGGDWGRFRLVPDLVRSILEKKPVSLRYPNAFRPWQHVLDAVHGILRVAEKLYLDPSRYSSDYNLGPKNSQRLSVQEFAMAFIKAWGFGQILSAEPNKPEAVDLELNTDRAKKDLDWETHYTNTEIISKTVDWYKEFADTGTAASITLKQINEYQESSSLVRH